MSVIGRDVNMALGYDGHARRRRTKREVESECVCERERYGELTVYRTRTTK